MKRGALEYLLVVIGGGLASARTVLLTLAWIVAAGLLTWAAWAGNERRYSRDRAQETE